jgi:hypothetical protein
LGLALGVLGNQLMDNREQDVRHAEAAYKYEVMTLFDSTRHNGQTKDCNHGPDKITTNKPRLSEGYARFRDPFKVGRFLSLVSTMLGLACVIGVRSGWDALAIVYYLITTGCTIGYGDLTPTTQDQKFLAIFFIPLSCLVMGHWLGYVANRIIEGRSSRFRIQYCARELTQDDLDAMDVNEDGKVTRAEFLEFMLLAMNKIDYEMVDELQAYFGKLDVAGTGELSRANLVEAARRKLKSPRRKLELASYKHRLLDQAALRRTPRPRPSILANFLHRLPSILGESKRHSWGFGRIMESFLSVDSEVEQGQNDGESPQHSTGGLMDDSSTILL